MRKLWHDEAWEEYLYWQSQDKKTLKKINRLLTDTALKAEKNPFGAGRKRAYTALLDQIKALHEQGMSVRKIGAELNIPSATVARYLKGVSE